MDNPDIAESAIANGDVDAIGLARALLADPEWPAKTEAGNAEDIRPCIACHVGCLQRIFHMKDMSCALNPACCNEKHLAITPAGQKKKVMVIGGGIAGMEAARVSALRGHQVDLYEKSHQLGGAFIPASSMSFKESDKRLIEWYKTQMKKLGIHVHMETEVTDTVVEAEKPDIVYVANGSSSKKLPVRDADQSHVIGAIEALNREKPIGNNVVIVGGGLTGIELAYDLALQGKHVNVVETLSDILTAKEDLCAANENMLRMAIAYHTIGIHTDASITNISVNAVTFTQNGATKTLPADTVIVCIGYTSNKLLYDSLKKCSAQIEVIGDANKVSNLMGAIWTAYELASTV